MIEGMNLESLIDGVKRCFVETLQVEVGMGHIKTRPCKAERTYRM